MRILLVMYLLAGYAIYLFSLNTSRDKSSAARRALRWRAPLLILFWPFVVTKLVRRYRGRVR